MKKNVLFLLLSFLFMLISENVSGQTSIKSIRNEPLNERIINSKVVRTKSPIKSESNLKQQRITAKKVTSDVNSNLRSTNADPVTPPYFQDFEEALPLADLGWTVISGGKSKDMDVYLGTGYFDSFFFLGAPYDEVNARNEWAVSPGISLEVGKTYKYEVYGMLPGWEGVKEEFKVAVGTSPSVSSLTTIIIDKTGSNAVASEEWVKFTGKFTPSASGTYYFGLNVCSPADVNLTSFDNIFIAEENTPTPPIANIYTKGGLWSEDIEAGIVFISRNQTIKHTFFGENITSFSWNFSDGTNPITSNETVASVVYQNEGIHDVTLNLTGEDGNTKDFQTSFEMYRSFGFNEYVGNRKSYDALAKYLLVDSYSFLFGPTPEYGAVAEKFEIPSNETVKISELAYYIDIANIASENQTLKCPIYIFDADAEGNPGEVLAAFTETTFANLFGTEPIEDAALAIEFEEPVEVTGSFFVAFDFSNIYPDANNYIGLYTTNPRKYADCTAYAYSDSDSKWSPMSNLFTVDEKPIELSGCIFPKVEWITDNVGIKETVADDNIKVTTSGNVITVDGAEDLNISVVTLDGKVIYNNIAKGSVNIPVAYQGLYLVKTGSKVTKVIVR